MVVAVGEDAHRHVDPRQAAYRAQRTLRCRYSNDRGEVRDREIEPWFVFSNLGRWYVQG